MLALMITQLLQTTTSQHCNILTNIIEVKKAKQQEIRLELKEEFHEPRRLLCFKQSHGALLPV